MREWSWRGETGEIKRREAAPCRAALFPPSPLLTHTPLSSIPRSERSNWTHEPTLEDGLGHGSFVAGVVAGSSPACPGLAPDALLHTFRVFTNDQVSFTSWFLDAFNYALATRMHVINLSIGGPDWLDTPFVDKVREVTAAGVVMVSAIGNDGPHYGTLNNPADAPDVIGVGGIGWDDAIAAFSSRGMTTWELPRGTGRVKPDVVAYGRDVIGSKIGDGCRALSGTSVASPVVAGGVALLASAVPAARRWHATREPGSAVGIINPASMKQALLEGADVLPGVRAAEQGAGRLNLAASAAVLAAYTPRASAFPASLDWRACPYAWPLCKQPLAAGSGAWAAPAMANVTLLNGMGVVGWVEGAPTFTPTNEAGRALDVRFEWSPRLWPWSGYLAVYVRVEDSPAGRAAEGVAEGVIEVTVVSPSEGRADDPTQVGDALPSSSDNGPPTHLPLRRSTVSIPLAARVAPPPPRAKRLLWSQRASVRYPPAYLPRDSLAVTADVLDWHGDHPATNFHRTLDFLTDVGFTVDILASPATCFNASEYGALLVVDPEEEWHAEEVAKLERDVKEAGLGLLVVGEWFNTATMAGLRFYDDNTRSWWTPVTGGANIPAVNDLLAPHGAALGDAVLEGDVSWRGERGGGRGGGGGGGGRRPCPPSLRPLSGALSISFSSPSTPPSLFSPSDRDRGLPLRVRVGRQHRPLPRGRRPALVPPQGRGGRRSGARPACGRLALRRPQPGRPPRRPGPRPLRRRPPGPVWRLGLPGLLPPARGLPGPPPQGAGLCGGGGPGWRALRPRRPAGGAVHHRGRAAGGRQGRQGGGRHPPATGGRHAARPPHPPPARRGAPLLRRPRPGRPAAGLRAQCGPGV